MTYNPSAGNSATNWSEIPGRPGAFPPALHSHSTVDIVGIDEVLALRAPVAHSHATSDVAGLVAALAGKAASSHLHVIADVTGLQTTLDAKQAAFAHYSKSAGATTTGANTTPVSVAGAVFDYAANAVYRIWVMGRLNSTAATTGAAIQFDLSSAVTAIDVQAIHALTAVGGVNVSYSIADDTSAGVTSGVPAGPLDVPIVADGLLVTGANTGTCQLRLRSETTAVTELMAGTVMIAERVA